MRWGTSAEGALPSAGTVDAGATLERTAVCQVSNPRWQSRVLGKAGASRWIGRRPKVRGVAMNAVDHPMGGGEGRSEYNMRVLPVHARFCSPLRHIAPAMSASRAPYFFHGVFSCHRLWRESRFVLAVGVVHKRPAHTRPNKVLLEAHHQTPECREAWIVHEQQMAEGKLVAPSGALSGICMSCCFLGWFMLTMTHAQPLRWVTGPPVCHCFVHASATLSSTCSLGYGTPDHSYRAHVTIVERGSAGALMHAALVLGVCKLRMVTQTSRLFPKVFLLPGCRERDCLNDNVSGPALGSADCRVSSVVCPTRTDAPIKIKVYCDCEWESSTFHHLNISIIIEL